MRESVFVVLGNILNRFEMRGGTDVQLGFAWSIEALYIQGKESRKNRCCKVKSWNIK